MKRRTQLVNREEDNMEKKQTKTDKLYTEFYNRIDSLLDEFDKFNFEVSATESPFFLDGEEESMMDTVLYCSSKPVVDFLNDWGAPLVEYNILPDLRFTANIPIFENRYPDSKVLNFRLCDMIPDEKTDKAILLVPHSPDFFDRLRILARVKENISVLNEGICNKGIELYSSPKADNEIDALLSMAFFDSWAIYDGIQLDTSPERKDLDALRSMLRKAIKDFDH